MSTLVESLKSSSFVIIKDGCSLKPPIFIVHGVCGRVQFAKLARHIRTDNPVYGIQARGIDGIDPPFDRIEDMSNFYLEALSQFHPYGPYILIGYSFGGLVALEMARQLIKKGMCVPLLFLVDAYPHPRYLMSDHRKRLLVRRLRSHLEKMWQLSLPDAFSYFARGVRNRLHVSSGSSESLTKTHHERNSVLDLVANKAYEALANYRPEFYPGKINFIAPEEKSFFPEDPEAIWAHLADKLEVDIIPGDHLSMVTTKFEGLAAVINRRLRELDSQPPLQLART